MRLSVCDGGCSERLRTQIVPSQVRHLRIYTGLRLEMTGYANLRARPSASVPRVTYRQMLLFLLLLPLLPLLP
jgi:hypothetical protein